MKKNTHLIYLDDNGHAWKAEYSQNSEHPENAIFFSNIPSENDSNWIEGKPKKKNIQYLTLFSFYPSGRLDVEIEIDLEPKPKYELMPAFFGCLKHMPLSSLEFNLVPRNISKTIHRIGLLNFYGKEPTKTIDIELDNLDQCLIEAKKIMKPSFYQKLVHMEEKINTKHSDYYSKTLKIKKED